MAKVQLHEYRELLDDTAKQLYRWANEARRGGWSTQHIEPMRQWASRISEFLVITEGCEPPSTGILEDGVSKTCQRCGNDTMHIVRPGKHQCSVCD